MIDRQLVGDIGLAILLALPGAGFVRPEPIAPTNTVATPMVEKAAVAERSALERRVSLPS